MLPIATCDLYSMMQLAMIKVTGTRTTRERGADHHTMRSGPGTTGLDTLLITIMSETGVTTMVAMDTHRITVATIIIISMAGTTMTMIPHTTITTEIGSTPGNSSKTGICTMVS